MKRAPPKAFCCVVTIGGRSMAPVFFNLQARRGSRQGRERASDVADVPARGLASFCLHGHVPLFERINAVWRHGCLSVVVAGYGWQSLAVVVCM